MRGTLGTVTELKTAAGVSPIAVASTATAYTPSFSIEDIEAFGAEFLAACGGAGVPDVLVELEESMDDTNFSEPDGFSDVINLSDENRHIKKIEPVPAKRARFKMTGQGTNPSDTTVQIKMFVKEYL